MRTSHQAGSLLPRLTILMVTWNGWPDTRRCLDSIYASTVDDLEVMVFDNASRDGTPGKIQQLFPNVCVVRNSENVGHTVGVNRCLAESRGKYVLVLDSDTELAPTSVALMLAFLESQAGAGVVAPRTFNSDGTVQESARRFPHPINGLFGRQSALTRWFPRNPLSRRYLQTDQLSTDEPYEVEQVSGACMLFRRELFETVGPWDEGYFAYWVDSDWCFRVRKAGWKVYCVPKAKIVHQEQNHSGQKKSWRRIWLFHYGAYRFYKNNMTWGIFDPRAVLALVALSTRGLFQLAHNIFLPSRVTE